MVVTHFKNSNLRIIVMPAKAGIQQARRLDSGLRRNDVKKKLSHYRKDSDTRPKTSLRVVSSVRHFTR